MTSQSETLSDSICIGCGLCCDGTLHGATTVQASDERAVEAARLKIVTEGKKSFFRQPCPHFRCGSCSIYGQRPGVCRTYECALLARLNAGTIDEMTARTTISLAKKLIEAVKDIDPAADTPAKRSALSKRLKTQMRQIIGHERRELAKKVLDIAALEHYLSTWFLKEKKSSEQQAKNKL